MVIYLIVILKLNFIKFNNITLFIFYRKNVCSIERYILETGYVRSIFHKN